jgi:hypothetical protein
MSFKNLETRYKEKVNDLYRGGKYKFDGGRASSGLNDDPLMVRAPGESQFGIRHEGRSLPFSSAPRDVIRLTKFTTSLRGILHLAKQQLLQTGNTFEQTRLLNPIFAIGNAIPFLHIRRHLRPLSTLFRRTDTEYSNVKKLGQLQKGTYDKLTNSGLKLKILQKLSSPFTAKKNVGDEFGYDEDGWKKTRPELGKTDVQYHLANLSRFKFGGTVSAPTFIENKYGAMTQRLELPASSINLGFRTLNLPPVSLQLPWDGNYTTYLSAKEGSDGEKIPKVDRSNIDYIRPFVRATLAPSFRGGQDSTTAPKNIRSDVITKTAIIDKYKDADISGSIDKQHLVYGVVTEDFIQELTNGEFEAQPFLHYFSGSDYAIRSHAQKVDGSLNARDLARVAREQGRKISYLRDPANEPATVSGDVLPRYKNLKTVESDEFEDAIVVSFAMGQKQHVQFRAFIRDISQSASPEYKTSQYIGRIEKFISYITVERTVSFTLDILAFSKDELQIVWDRINYLTALVYPYNIYKGVLQPNIARLTIGSIYVDQPGYVTSMNTKFNEISQSWDLDGQVPIGATIVMEFKIIEKDTKIANKSFYGITEPQLEPEEQPETFQTG